MESNNTIKKSAISILNFAKEKLTNTYSINPNEKYIKYGSDNKFPKKLLELYQSVPEHAKSLDFTESNIIGEGIDNKSLDYWDLKRIISDYLIFGAYSVQVIKTRNGGAKYVYIDFSKIRYSTDKKQIGFSENWEVYKPEIVWSKISTGPTEDGIYIYKNTKSREIYPVPQYFSAYLALDTMKSMMHYHNNSANNGFSPSVLINFNNGIPEEEIQRQTEQSIIDKFTGGQGQRFVLSWNDSKETATTTEKLENDNLDQKFETLQKFIQNQIIIANSITSGTLLGVRPENQGFSQTEYDEAHGIFKKVTIKDYRRELEYSLSILLGETIKFIDEQIVTETTVTPTNNNVDKNTTGGQLNG